RSRRRCKGSKGESATSATANSTTPTSARACAAPASSPSRSARCFGCSPAATVSTVPCRRATSAAFARRDRCGCFENTIMPTPHYPSLYQINTRVLLTDLARQLGRPATLDDIADAYLSDLARKGFDWIWLLSVWQTGAAGQRVSRTEPNWRKEF